jgi:hypothetical protein
MKAYKCLLKLCRKWMLLPEPIVGRRLRNMLECRRQEVLEQMYVDLEAELCLLRQLQNEVEAALDRRSN